MYNNTINPLSATTLHLRLNIKETETTLATATGFLFRHKEEVYLITNWHNVTGKNPLTGKCLSWHCGFPDIIETYLLPKESDFRIHFVIRLYSDEERTKPVWLVHPIHKEKIDVIAIKLTDIPVESEIVAINESDFIKDYPLEVTDTVFVLGYPIDLDNHGDLPIWKKASVATEPCFEIDNLPKLLIDTATRQGMSGSPVVCFKDLSCKNGEFSGTLGTGKIFVGIYSGRIGEDELKAQLGIVWRKEVIEEIIEGGVTADISFQ